MVKRALVDVAVARGRRPPMAKRALVTSVHKRCVPVVHARRSGPLVCLCLAAGLLLAALAAVPCLAQPAIVVSPSTVEVGLNFGGASVAISGAGPADAQAIVKVVAAPSDVKLSRKDRILGIFWMTTERAVVQNMPTYLALYASRSVDTLLSHEEQVRLGVDAACLGLMARATVVTDSPSHAALPPDQAQRYVESLRDIYIKNEKYTPCLSCHRAQAAAARVATQPGETLNLVDGRWSLRLQLPSDAPLGNYQVTAYYVVGGKVVESQTADFKVEKAGLVATLGTLAQENGALYGGISLIVVILVGLGIGAVFPKGGH